jgi:hypothetical protein
MLRGLEQSYGNARVASIATRSWAKASQFMAVGIMREASLKIG